ncbi:MAG: hypothetical protein Fur0010_10810 [Bdellovibrio sp.]
MTLNEVRSKVMELKSQAQDQRTIEFVCDNQKYFLTDIEKNPNQFKIVVTRKKYCELSAESFLELLATGNTNAPLTIFNQDKGGNEKSVTGFYLSDHAIEIAGQ